MPGSTSAANCTLSYLTCPAGHFIKAGTTASCQACPPQSTSKADSPSISDCKCLAGYTGSDGSACEACSGGTYKETQGSGECRGCPKGSFAAVAATACNSCPSGSDSAAGSDAVDDCKCNAGFSGPDGKQCAECPEQTFKNSLGSGACQGCPRGTYASAGATACETCSDTSPLCPGARDPVASGQASGVATVKFSLSMRLARSEFTKANEESVKQGVAATAGVDVSKVSIVVIDAQSGGVRRLLQASDGIKLDIEIKAPDMSTATLFAAQLTTENLNAHLNKNGLPKIVVVSEPVVLMTLSSAPVLLQTASPSPAAREKAGAGNASKNVSCSFTYLFVSGGADDTEASEKVAGVLVAGTCVSASWVLGLVVTVLVTSCCCCAGCYYRKRVKSRAIQGQEALYGRHEMTMVPDTREGSNADSDSLYIARPASETVVNSEHSEHVEVRSSPRYQPPSWPLGALPTPPPPTRHQSTSAVAHIHEVRVDVGSLLELPAQPVSSPSNHHPDLPPPLSWDPFSDLLSLESTLEPSAAAVAPLPPARTRGYLLHQPQVDITSLPSITDATDATERDMAADRQNAPQVKPTTDIKPTPDGAPPPPQRPLPPQSTDLPKQQPQESTFNTYYNPRTNFHHILC